MSKKIGHFNGKEIWKDVVGYPNYEVSNKGNVRSKERMVHQMGHRRIYSRTMKSQLLKQRKQNSGYFIVWLSFKGKSKAYTVHRLVATAFMPMETDKKDVNHINGVKTDNRVDNLEWCTRSENIIHSYNVLKRSKKYTRKKVKCVETGHVFDSISKASKETGTSWRSINHAINDINKTAGGYKWESV